MTALAESDIIYDWNSVGKRASLAPGKFSFFDETLRDGIQSPSVHDPHIEDKMRIIELLDAIGVDHTDIGLPGAGPRAMEDCVRLATFIRDQKLRIRPACAARTHPNDIRPIIEISQRVGIAIEVMTFIGSSPIRQYAEGWDVGHILKLSTDAIRFATRSGLPCTYVTEDTTRSRPEVLASLFKNAIDSGATRLCICDTVGHATPDGIHNLLRFTRAIIAGMGLEGRIGIDWHGHNDRGLAVTNCIHALEFGADRIHGTVMGIGERVGNAALDQVLVNLALLGELPGQDLSRLGELVRLVSQACRVPIPFNYPVFGADAFRTATGVHAAAIIKAERKGDAYLADRIYSSVPAGLFGRTQEIEIGPMSGESNVVYWLRRHGIEPEAALVRAVFAEAKRSDHLLTPDEIHDIIQRYQRGQTDRQGGLDNSEVVTVGLASR
ncbi:MAG: LeuA family protein [Myxococcales bacterium]|nr:LeuA family protein [Myxococcota bacterium]MDW8282542.1 LeuA family protein [Myxococcales bacterium]